MKEKNVILEAQISDQKVQNLQLQELMKGEVNNQSKMLVSGNSEAKAKHFNNTKMELSNLKQEQVKNLNKISQFEKQD